MRTQAELVFFAVLLVLDDLLAVALVATTLLVNEATLWGARRREVLRREQERTAGTLKATNPRDLRHARALFKLRKQAAKNSGVAVVVGDTTLLAPDAVRREKRKLRRQEKARKQQRRRSPAAAQQAPAPALPANAQAAAPAQQAAADAHAAPVVPPAPQSPRWTRYTPTGTTQPRDGWWRMLAQSEQAVDVGSEVAMDMTKGERWLRYPGAGDPPADERAAPAPPPAPQAVPAEQADGPSVNDVGDNDDDDAAAETVPPKRKKKKKTGKVFFHKKLKLKLTSSGLKAASDAEYLEEDDDGGITCMKAEHERVRRRAITTKKWSRIWQQGFVEAQAVVKEEANAPGGRRRSTATICTAMEVKHDLPKGSLAARRVNRYVSSGAPRVAKANGLSAQPQEKLLLSAVANDIELNQLGGIPPDTEQIMTQLQDLYRSRGYNADDKQWLLTKLMRAHPEVMCYQAGAKEREERRLRWTTSSNLQVWHEGWEAMLIEQQMGWRGVERRHFDWTRREAAHRQEHALALPRHAQ